MYKRKLNQVSLFENPAMFGGIGGFRSLDLCRRHLLGAGNDEKA